MAAMVSDSECILSVLMRLQCIWLEPQRKKATNTKNEDWKSAIIIIDQPQCHLILLQISQLTPSPDKNLWSHSLRKQPTFYNYPTNATAKFPVSWSLRDKHRNSILMICQFPDLGSASDGHATREIICFNQSKVLPISW